MSGITKTDAGCKRRPLANIVNAPAQKKEKSGEQPSWSAWFKDMERRAEMEEKEEDDDNDGETGVPLITLSSDSEPSTPEKDGIPVITLGDSPLCSLDETPKRRPNLLQRALFRELETGDGQVVSSPLVPVSAPVLVKEEENKTDEKPPHRSLQQVVSSPPVPASAPVLVKEEIQISPDRMEAAATLASLSRAPKRAHRPSGTVSYVGTHKGRFHDDDDDDDDAAEPPEKKADVEEEAGGEQDEYRVVTDASGRTFAVMLPLRESQSLPVLSADTVDEFFRAVCRMENEDSRCHESAQTEHYGNEQRDEKHDKQGDEQSNEKPDAKDDEEEDPQPGPSRIVARAGDDASEELASQSPRSSSDSSDSVASTISQTGGAGVRPLVVLGAVTSRLNKVFGVDQHSVAAVFSQALERDPERLFPLAVEQAVSEARRMLPSGIRPSHVAVSLDVEGTTLSFHSGLVPIDMFNGNRLAEQISRAAQSEKAHLVAGKKTELSVSYLRMPSGNGRPHGALTGDTKNITLVRGDRLCLVKAVLIGAAFVDMITTPEGTNRKVMENRYKNLIKSDREHALTRKARRFMEENGYTKEQGYTLSDVDLMQQFLGGRYRIIVFQDIPHTEPVYDYHVGPADRVIGLRYREEIGEEHGHFDHVKRIAPWIGRSYYCFGCKKGYNNRTDHLDCPYRCTRCGEYGSMECAGDEDLQCPVCEDRFPSQQCLANHARVGASGHSMCSLKKRCPKCRQWDLTERTGMEHKCGHIYCKRCVANRPDPHVCCIAPLRKKKVKNHRFTIFDIESTVVDVVRPDGSVMKEHKPNLIMTLKCCAKCVEVKPKGFGDALPTCAGNGGCGKRFKIYSQLDNPDMDVVEAFVADLVRPENSNRTIIAHNLSGYDGQFILREIERQKHLYAESLVLNGRKIIKAELFNGSQLLDTLNYFQQPLSKFPATFQLTELHKGHFPHRMNLPSFYDYEGDLPSLDNYIDSLFHTTKQMKEITVWWREEDARLRASNERWSFKQSLYTYCYSDVLLLYEAVLAFRQTFKEITDGIEVFAVSSTAASAAMATFRTNHLTPDTIAISDPPQHRVIQSVKAAKYFSWYNHLAAARGEPEARFALTPGGEHRVPGTNYRVDGFVERSDGRRPLAIDYHGCYYHACSCKYSARSIVGEDVYGRPIYAHTIRARDRARADRIRELYDYQVVRECEADAEVKKNDAMTEFMLRCEIQTPLHIRDALYGGRTEAFTLYRLGEIFYDDVTSLYPFVNKYPVGSPERTVVDKANCPISDPSKIESDGFMKCKVLAPPRLFLPVLPHRPPNRQSLLFGLCGTCMRVQKTGFCPHSDEERSFWGTWSTAELKFAVARGYVILDVHESLHYKNWKQYDKENGEEGPLSSFIDCFLRVKQEASGLPPGVSSDAEIAAYIDSYREHEGIELCRENIKFNAGQRAGSKLLLNSLWGKLGENPDKSYTVHCTNPGDFWMVVGNGSNEVRHINFISDSKVIVHYKKAKETQMPSKTSAEAYAALTTAYARIHLYEALEKVAPEYLLYADTDSIQLEVPAGEANPLQHMIGDYLGDLTSEIPEGWIETEFVAAGPKNYAYKYRNAAGEEKTEVKCRGFKLTNEASRKITFDEVKRRVDALVEGRDVPPLDVRYSLIRPDGSHRVFTVPTTKRYRAVFNKRMIGLVPEDRYRTLPWGYKQ